MDIWKVAADERVKHDAQFATLTQGTHINGEQARGFFLQSNLPPALLGQIWGMADLTADGMMDRKEFSIAMTLIKRRLQGYQLPTTLPASMLTEPSMGGTLPHGMTGLPPNMPAMSSATLPSRMPNQSAALSLGVAPASPTRSVDGGADWAVPHASRLKYNQLFNREDRKHVGYLTGLDARQLLFSTGLPQNLLAQIWSLADVDGDGRLTSEEFSLAMFLADMVKMGQPLPMTLPPNFIPPSMRSISRSNSAAQSALPTLGSTSKPNDSFGDLIPGGFGGAQMPLVPDSKPQEEPLSLTPLTLEDKRRENFAKGNAELEKRRAELKEQQRKEEEARLAKERAEQEKRDAIKREQERKKLAEQERLLERQRQLEAEREEQRRKALEARESARKEMERQRQQEWERQRKQALLAEKKRHEETVQLLESQVNNLKYEIETMDNKKNELVARIAEGKENVVRSTGYIDDMRSTRDSLMSALSSHQNNKSQQERLYIKLTSEYNQVKQTLQARQAANPISDNFKQHQNLHATKKQQVETLRQSLNELNSNKSTLSSEVNMTRDTLAAIKESIAQLQKVQTESRGRVKSRSSQWENEKKRRADEKIRAEREARLKEEADKQKKLEEEKKKNEEDKWSVFKDLDFSAPSATASVPGTQAISNTGWPAASDKTVGQQAPANDLWGGSGSQGSGSQGSGSADLFAGSSWSHSVESSDNTWNEPAKSAAGAWSKPSDSSWASSSNSLNSPSSKPPNSSSLFGGQSKAAPALQPPPKTPTKKETTFGVFAPQKEKVSAPVEPAAPVKPAAPVAPAASQLESSPAPRKVEIYEVMYDFEGRSADELSLDEKEKIKVYPDEQESAEPGWMSGWKGDVAGIFPVNYVTKVRDVYEPALSSDPSKKTSINAEVTSGMSRRKSLLTRGDSAFDEVRSSPTLEEGSPAPEGLTCTALYQWRAKKENHLSFNEGDVIKVLMQQDLWWQGSLANGQRGWFPKSYVKVIDSTTTVLPQPSSAPVAAAAIDTSRFYDQVPNVQSPPAATAARAYDEPADSSSSRFYDQVPGGDSNSTTSTSQAERHLALHDYQSDVAGDLNFSAGELVTVTSKDGEWWTGTIGGRSGIFPANYVAPGEEETAVPQDIQTNNTPCLPKRPPAINVESQPIAPNHPSVTKKHPRAAPRTPTHAASAANAAKATSPAATPVSSSTAASSQAKEIGKVIAAYEATGKEQLSLKPNQLIHIKKKSPSGWWEGELVAKGQKKQIGWFPKDYVKLLPTGGNKAGERSSTPASELLDSPRAQDTSPSTPAPAAAPAVVTPAAAPVAAHQGKVQASYPYTAQNDDELSFQQGDIIAVVNKDDPDWWSGQLNGLTGVFPSNYVQHYTEPLSDAEKTRQQAITELINTEETYVNDMVVALEAFYKPLKESKCIPDNELDAIFVNWQELIHCNRKLVNAFKVRQNTCGQDEPIHVIGDVLVENFPNMTPYIRFCSRQLYAAQLLQKRIETDAEARQFISKCQQDERVRGMPLSSYIIKPMQRITKYPLLVLRILQHTSQDHPDYQQINEAYTKAQELGNQVNEGVREEDNSDKLEWVQNHVSCDGLTEHITFNSLTNALGQRKFIYSGTLTKLRSGRELYVFLFNDFILFTSPVSSSSAEKVFQLDTKGIVFKMYKTPLFLNEVTVREPINLEKADTENLCLQICHIENVIDIKCSTTTERNAWMKRLTVASEEALSMERVKRERAQSLRLPPVGRLVLVLREAVDIVGVKPSTGKSDPYCEVTMGSILHKTKVVPNTLNPKWNSNMQFPIKSVDDDVLCFTVFDQDRFSPNDFLGRTELRVKDILKETKEKKGPILKYARLQEVNSGDIVVKLDLQLYRSLTPVPSQRR